MDSPTSQFSAFNYLPMQIAVLSSNADVIFTNAAWDRFAKENAFAGGPFIGQNYLNVCKNSIGAESNQADQAAAAILKVINGELPSYADVYPCHAEKEKRWFKVFVSPFQGGAIVTHCDLTKEGLTNLPIAGKESFYGMIHDLKSPIAVIYPYLELLQSEPSFTKNKKGQKWLGQIKHATDNLFLIIKSLMEKAEGKQPELKDEEIFLAPFFNEILSSHSLNFEQKGICSTHNVPGELSLSAPKAIFLSIFENLISNAVKYNRISGTIHLDACINASGGVEVSIQDTGFGISDENVASIFHPFQRHISENNQVEGSGVGLANVHRGIKSLDGDISVTSKPNKGSTFTVIFPAWRTREVPKGIKDLRSKK